MKYDSAVIGNQFPRIQHLVASRQGVGKEAVDLAALAGLELDPWEAWILEESSKTVPETYWNPYTARNEPRWAAFEVGLIVSRQNGKGSILEARELAGLFLYGERLIIHSAHQFDTSKEAFERILTLIEGTPELRAEVSRISRSHGEEGVELRNGQRLRFRTRTKGGGRGFTCDTLMLDEAMYLGATQVGALLPTLSARPNAQVWYTGSAGDKESTQLGRVRARGVKGDDPRLFFAEWSIDPCNDFCMHDCTDHDRPDTVESYKKANPGLGIRISVEHIESERRSMDAATFLQERLGVGDWPVEGDAWGVISEESWMSRVDESSLIEGDFVLALEEDRKNSFSCISAAGLNAEGMTHAEITGYETLDYRPGRSWVVERTLEICKGMKPKAVVIDKTSQASSHIDELTEPLEKLGIELLHPNSNEVAQACGDFYSAIIPRKGNAPTLVHIDQPPLTAAVAGADTRELSGMWAWSKRTSAVDISPLVSSTLAIWGFKKMQYLKAPSAPWMVRR